MPDHFEERLDGDLIARPTRESLRAGVGADKPLVMGTTDDEFSMAMADAAKALRWVPRGLLLGKFGFAEHCLDVPFFFDCLDGPAMDPLTGPNPPQDLADAIHGAAVSFVTAGDPGWTSWSSKPNTDAVFGGPGGVKVVEHDGYAGARPLL